MKKQVESLFIVLLLVTGCQKQTEQPVPNNQHKTPTSVSKGQDISGTYVGVLPCADCEGINTTITINENNTYTLQSHYIGKGNKVFEYKGAYHWNSKNTISLDNNQHAPNTYLVEANSLQQLDANGKKQTESLATHYQLYRQPNVSHKFDAENRKMPVVNLNNRMETRTEIKTVNPAVGKFALAETRWILVALNGKTVPTQSPKKYYLQLHSKDGRFSAFAGCNAITGNYVMKKTASLSFSGVVTTLMACEEMRIEHEFGNMLEKVDHYRIKGNTLQVCQENRKPIAHFIAEANK